MNKMYNNPYMQNYNTNYGQQSLSERIDTQIAQLNQMKEQLKNNQQPAINQTFQLAPNSNHAMRYANTIDDVNKETVYFDTPFFSKDMSVLWVKSAKGDIKSYELSEIVQKDEKDLQIELLQAQINEMKGMIKNARANDEYIDESVESEKSTDVPVPRTSTKKSK
jgi:hypothetical protein